MTNIAILGAGSIARAMAKTLRMMQAHGEGMALYAVASRSIEKAAAFAAAEGFVHAYGSYEALVCDPAVELVYIATPHSHHAAHIRLCVEHGKAVLCEKAFTANEDQAREALALAESRGVLVTEAIWPRYMPSRRMIDDLLAGGAIGRPVMLTANLGYDIARVERLRNPALAGGALLDVGVYPLNFASMAFGDDIVRVESTVEKFDTGVDLTENITLTYADGRVAHIMATAACRTDRRGVIYGTEGYLTVDNVNNPQVITLHPKAEDYRAARVIPVPEQLTGYEYEVRACLEALQAGRIECPDMPHAQTLRILRLTDRLRHDWGVRYPFE